jgi:hypothetical protein
MVARTDTAFLMHTIPHLVKVCNFPFLERVLVVDTAPLSGDKVDRPGIGTMAQLREQCNELLNKGIVDKIIDIDYTDSYRKRVYKKHFGTALIKPTHNYKGYPILGTIFSLEEMKGDYVVHFDSDMLLYQAAGYSWITQGINLLKKRPEIMTIRPLAGPPTKDGTLHLQNPLEVDADGFHAFKTFGSRVYMLDRKRFDDMLPFQVLWRPYSNKISFTLPRALQTALNCTTGLGLLGSWEKMFSARLAQTHYIRANLDSHEAWTLHPKDRGEAFIHALPEIIEKVEAGWYPSEQAGYYDMRLTSWLQALELEKTPST